MRAFWIFLLFIILGVVFTWPLVLHFNTHILGSGGDGPIFLWSAYHFKEWVLGREPLFFTQSVFYPVGVPLYLHTLALVNAAFIALFSNLLGWVGASNLWLLLGIGLSGLGTFKLLEYMNVRSWAAFAGGMVFTFSPYVTAHWLGHANLYTLFFLPWFVLALFMVKDSQRTYWPLIAGLIGGLAMLNDFYNLGYIGGLWTIFFIWVLFTARDRVQVAVRLLVSMGFSVGLWMLWLVPAFNFVSGEKQLLFVPIKDIHQHSADLLRFVVPSFLHSWWGDLARTIPGAYAGGVEGTVFAGWGPLFLVLALLLMALNKRIKLNRSYLGLWLSILLAFGLLSLGPELKIADHLTGISLPYGWVHEFFTPIASFRVPARFDAGVMLALAVLVGMSLQLFFRWFESAHKRRTAGMLVVTLLMTEFFVAPYPLQNLSIPKAYDIVAKDDSAKSVLTLPWGINDGFGDEGIFNSKLPYYQTYHRKAIPAGSASRVPREVFDFFNEKEMPFIGPFQAFYDPGMPLGDFPVRWRTDYVLIDKTKAGRGLSAYTAYVTASGYGLVYEDTEYSVYRLP